MIPLSEFSMELRIPISTLRRLFDSGRLGCQRLRFGRHRAVLANEAGLVREKIREYLAERLRVAA